jgi:chromate reductase
MSESRPVRVLGISGSLRRASFNTMLLRHAGELLEAEGATFEIYEALREIPPYDQDDDVPDAPVAVARIRAAVGAADAIFITTPEYNYSIPGVLKNALDWVSRPRATHTLRDKPVAVIGASSASFGAAWAQAEVRKVLGGIGARVVDGEVRVGQATDRFDASGRLNDAQLEEQVRAVARALVAQAQAAPQMAALK